MGTAKTTSIGQFTCHKSPSKHRIFALIDDTAGLEAVTTLNADDSELTDALIDELNAFLVSGNAERLSVLLQRLPDPVRLAIDAVLRSHTLPPLGSVTGWGSRIDTVRHFGFSDDRDFDEHMQAAYTLGLGLRASNERDGNRVGWDVELRTWPGFAPRSREPRTWALPDGVMLSSTWTSGQTGGDPTTSALVVARAASEEGRWVRLHMIERGASDDPDGAASQDWVVDVLDAPIPIRYEEE